MSDGCGCQIDIQLLHHHPEHKIRRNNRRSRDQRKYHAVPPSLDSTRKLFGDSDQHGIVRWNYQQLTRGAPTAEAQKSAPFCHSPLFNTFFCTLPYLGGATRIASGESKIKTSPFLKNKNIFFKYVPELRPVPE